MRWPRGERGELITSLARVDSQEAAAGRSSASEAQTADTDLCAADPLGGLRFAR